MEFSIMKWKRKHSLSQTNKLFKYVCAHAHILTYLLRYSWHVAFLSLSLFENQDWRDAKYSVVWSVWIRPQCVTFDYMQFPAFRATLMWWMVWGRTWRHMTKGRWVDKWSTYLWILRTWTWRVHKIRKYSNWKSARCEEKRSSKVEFSRVNKTNLFLFPMLFC